MEAARKADSVISRMTLLGEDREHVLFQVMEGKREDLHTIQEIDADVFREIAARLPDAAKRAYSSPDLQTKISHQIIEKRCQALELLCQNQNIRDLYQAFHGTSLPLQEALPQMEESEISELIFRLATFIKEWNALPETMKQLYKPVNIRAIYDHPAEFEKIVEAVCSYNLFTQCKDIGLISGETVLNNREDVRARVREIATIPTQALQQAFTTQKTEVCTLMSRLRQLEVTVPPKLRGSFESMRESGIKLQSVDEEPSVPILALFLKDCRNLQEQIDTFELLIIEDIQNDLGVEQAIAQQIYRGAQDNWKNFIEIMSDGIVKQTHSIKGLKIYMLPGTNQLVADYGKEVIGRGTYKRIKSLYRLGSQEVVRLTSHGKEMKEPIQTKKEEIKVFEEDVKTELQARVVLSGVPNIASLTAVRYYNKEGVLKTRYIRFLEALV
jgi:hypothetical protein